KKQDEIERRVTDLLTLISLIDKAFLFPKQLSGGEAQKISIARALSTGPTIVFADEPTGNLDRETSLEIGKLFQKINSLGTTIILATHDHDIMELLKDARQIDLEKGKIKRDTKPKKESESKEKPEPEEKSSLVADDKKEKKEKETSSSKAKSKLKETKNLDKAKNINKKK
ncbi:ATP-binding cassette domain-containing protein, partial [Patescibacteria group bacterium]|nr:ATP-binding cassette domain-containing protein [Patescibacteria group bacterium]